MNGGVYVPRYNLLIAGAMPAGSELTFGFPVVAQACCNHAVWKQLVM